MTSFHRRVVISGMIGLAAILSAPPAKAQMYSGSHQMQSMRPVGMMGMPSMGRIPMMMGGMSGSNPMVSGMGGAPMKPMAQGGSSSMNSGYSGYGAASGQMRTMPRPYGSGDGYSSSPKQTPGQEQLASLRGHAGGLAWPLALRYVTRDEPWKERREMIDAQVDSLLAPGAGKSASAELVQKVGRDVARLQEHFNRESNDMPTTRQQESDARGFLRKLREALKQLTNAGMTAAY